MGEGGTSYLLTQLGYQAPAMLVYLVAFVLALVFMGRALMPSILTLVGVGILVVTTLAVAVVQALLIDARQAGGPNPGAFARWMQIVGVAGSCARAMGLGLLVTAIFVGRRSVAQGQAEPGRASPTGKP